MKEIPLTFEMDSEEQDLETSYYSSDEEKKEEEKIDEKVKKEEPFDIIKRLKSNIGSANKETNFIQQVDFLV